MGIYNIIKINRKCPKCKNIVEWQTKDLNYDGYPLANVLMDITLNERMDGEMHTYCDHCKTIFDVTIVKGKVTSTKQSKPITIIRMPSKEK